MWASIAVEAPADRAEALSEALLAAGALSVAVEDARAGTEFETPQFGEPGSPGTPLWDQSRVVALFEPAEDLERRFAAAMTTVGLDPGSGLSWEEVPEQDWVRLTQSQFEPIRISDRLWIVPSWHAAPDPAAVNLVLDPGLAFGTGSHPTTRLCLEWLEQCLRPGMSVLDYGCGSGILGIAALKCGAERVLGIDIDPAALAAAAANATRNGVRLQLAHSGERCEASFDCVVANILTNPLLLLAPVLSARLKAGGIMALSGILAAQADEVIAAYAPYLELAVGATDEGWIRLEGKKLGKLPSC